MFPTTENIQRRMFLHPEKWTTDLCCFWSPSAQHRNIVLQNMKAENRPGSDGPEDTDSYQMMCVTLKVFVGLRASQRHTQTHTERWMLWSSHVFLKQFKLQPGGILGMKLSSDRS